MPRGIKRLESNEEIIQRANRIYGNVPLRIMFRVLDPLPCFDPGDPSTHRTEQLPHYIPSNPVPEINLKDVWIEEGFGTYKVLRIGHPNAKTRYVWYTFLADRPGAVAKQGKMTLVAFQRMAKKATRKGEIKRPDTKPESRNGGKNRELRGETIRAFTTPAGARQLIGKIKELVAFSKAHYRFPEFS